jgi:glycosyltransferase involved in cell wall biosynthesis
MHSKTIAFVIPAFNEAATISAALTDLDELAEKISYSVNVTVVNDGSDDETLAELSRYQPINFSLTVVDLSRNFGKEAALSAGLMHAVGDAFIPLDADHQDPIELVPIMIERWEAGFEVVLAHRATRDSDSAFKRMSALWFYRLINELAEVVIPENVGDFRLMDKAVVDALRMLPENRRFMKGLFAWLGFRTTTVEYQRAPRSKGQTKFSSWRLWNLAIEGLTSFSTLPLRIWTYFGSLLALVSVLYGFGIILRTLIWGVDVPGYASLLTAILFLGGVQLIGIGIIGEYLGRTYLEAKRRPTYVVRSVVQRQPSG